MSKQSEKLSKKYSRELDKWASIKFEAWDKGQLLPGDKMKELFNDAFVVTQLASAAMCRTKTQLMGAFEELGEEDTIEFVERCEKTCEFFEELIKALQGARYRILVAASAQEKIQVLEELNKAA